MILGWHDFADIWSWALLRASWQGGIAFAIAWAFHRWCRVSPRVVCWVWRVVCVKMLLTLVWSQPVELPLLPAHVPDAAMYSPAPDAITTPVAELGIQEFETAPPLAHPASPRVSITISEILLPMWLVGVAYCVFRSGRQWQAARQLSRAEGVEANSRLLALCADEGERLGVRRLPRLVQSPCVGSPLLVGVCRPTIVVPERAEELCDDVELRMMLAHELAHQKRYDLAWNWLPTVVTWLCYFHPLVWLMVRRWSEAQEAACDELLIQRSAAQPSAYGRLLFKLSALKLLEGQPGLAAAGVLGTYRNLEQRIVALTLVRPRSPRRLGVAAFVVALVGLITIVPWRLVADELAAPAHGSQSTEDAGTDSKLAPTTQAAGDDQKDNHATRKKTYKSGMQKFFDWPINVTGRALDKDGQPIAGATIFIVATNVSPDKMLGKTTTDGEGRYRFDAAPVPIRIPAKKDSFEEGTFQIFGKAPGYGFAWFDMRGVYIDPRFIGPDGRKTIIHPERGFFPGEKIAIDLTFAPARTIFGRFVDDRGNPIAGVKLRIQSCDYAELAGRDENEGYRELRTNRQAAGLMPDQFVTTTGTDGRFAFASVPPDIVCSIEANHPEFGHTSFNTSTAEPPPAEHRGEQVLPPPIAITMSRARSVTVSMKYVDTGEPAHDALLVAYKQLGVGTSAWGYCNKDGQVTLKLPPGEYTLSANPPKDKEYVKAKSQLTVQDVEGEQTQKLILHRGCTLILKAIDADTGEGIEGATFWFQDDEYPGHDDLKKRDSKWFVQANTTTVDFPETDATGTVRAIVFPGQRIYGIGLNPLPGGYQATDEDRVNGRMLDVPAGKTVTAEFLLRK